MADDLSGVIERNIASRGTRRLDSPLGRSAQAAPDISTADTSGAAKSASGRRVKPRRQELAKRWQIVQCEVGERLGTWLFFRLWLSWARTASVSQRHLSPILASTDRGFFGSMPSDAQEPRGVCHRITPGSGATRIRHLHGGSNAHGPSPFASVCRSDDARSGIHVPFSATLNPAIGLTDFESKRPASHDVV